MSNSPSPTPAAAGPSFLEALVRRRTQTSYALFVIAALLLIIPLALLIQVKFRLQDLELWPVALWGLGLALVVLTGAILNLTAEPGPELGEMGKVRVLLLALGGSIGLATALLGFALPLTYYKSVYGGGLPRWRESPWALAWPGLALLAGLGLMFASLQLARGMERTHGVLRRLLYGFNAVLASLLLLIALALLNVLPYTHARVFSAFNETFDWTRSGLYEISDQNKEFLRTLDQPVKVYVLLPRNTLPGRDTETLLETCRGVTGQITWQSVSRDQDRPELERLRAKYALPDSQGVLVVYGTEPKTESQFIKINDLYREDPGNPRDPSAGSQYVYTGEGALMNAIQFLAENKKSPVVYFTQGSGEIDFNAGMRRGGDDLSTLRDRLRENNYEAKELRLGVKTKSVPDDAEAVVIARPTQKLPDSAIKALRDYAKGKKGKLMVLLGVTTREGEMVKTGLEGLLREFNVKVNDDRVLMADNGGPAQYVFAYANRDLDNPITRAFDLGNGRVSVFLFDDARTVEPLQAGPAGAVSAQELMYAVGNMAPWSETDLGANPEALRDELLKPGNEKLQRDKFKDKKLCLAVTVAESKGGGMPHDRFHEAVTKEERPLMVVFGAADWVSSGLLNSRLGGKNYQLFSRSLSWLRGRTPPAPRKQDEKKRQEYALTATPVTVSRIEWLPLGLMFLGVIGLGCGVWVVRRR